MAKRIEPNLIRTVPITDSTSLNPEDSFTVGKQIAKTRLKQERNQRESQKNPIYKIYPQDAERHLDDLLERIHQTPSNLIFRESSAVSRSLSTENLDQKDTASQRAKNHIDSSLKQIKDLFVIAAGEHEKSSTPQQRLIAQQNMNLRGHQSISCLLQLNNLRTAELVREKQVLERHFKDPEYKNIHVQLNHRLQEIAVDLNALSTHHRLAILKLHMFDREAEKNGGYPPNSWTDLGKSILKTFHNLNPFVEKLSDANRRLREEELVLYHLLALNGMNNMSEAIDLWNNADKAFTHARSAISNPQETVRDALTAAKNFILDTTKQTKLLKDLMLWVHKHPSESMVLSRNLGHLQAKINNLNIFNASLARATAKNQIQDFLAGEREILPGTTIEATLPPALIGLVYLSDYFPSAMGTYKALIGQDSTAAITGDVIGFGVSTVAPTWVSNIANAGTRFAVGLARTQAEINLAHIIASNRDIEVGLSALTTALRADNIADGLKRAKDVIAQREILNAIGTAAADFREGGALNWFKRKRQEFSKWLTQSSVGEKIIRTVAQVGIPAAIAGWGAVAAVTALIANPFSLTAIGGVVLVVGGMMGTYYLTKLAIRTFAGNYFQIKETRKAVREHMTQLRFQDTQKRALKELDDNFSIQNTQAKQAARDAITAAKATDELTPERLANTYKTNMVDALVTTALQTPQGQFLTSRTEDPDSALLSTSPTQYLTEELNELLHMAETDLR